MREVSDISKHEMYRAEIKQWVQNHYKKGILQKHPNWDTNIWNWKHEQIIEYLLMRLRTTRDEGEYFHCMVFLYKSVLDDVLFDPFPLWKYMDDGSEGNHAYLCEHHQVDTSSDETSSVEMSSVENFEECEV